MNQTEDAKDTEDMHPCPFQCEMNYNCEPYCYCSPQQQTACAMEV